MPLPCVEELEEEQLAYNQSISCALVETVRQGMDEERVTCGIQPCVQLMHTCPENVMLCLLIQLSAALDASVKIPLLLIKDICQTKDINFLHVLGENKMTQLLSTCLSQSTKSRNDVMKAPQTQEENGTGVGCIMIKYPKHNTSSEDDLVANFIQEKMQHKTDPAVMIPDLTKTGVDKNLGFKLKTKKMKTPVQASSQPTQLF